MSLDALFTKEQQAAMDAASPGWRAQYEQPSSPYSKGTSLPPYGQKYLDLIAPGWREWTFRDPRMQAALTEWNSLSQTISSAQQRVQQKVNEIFLAIDKLRPKIEKIITLTKQAGVAWQQGRYWEYDEKMKEVGYETGDETRPPSDWDIIRSVFGFVAGLELPFEAVIAAIVSIPVTIGLNASGQTILQKVADTITQTMNPGGVFDVPIVNQAISTELGQSIPNAVSKLLHLPINQLQLLLDTIASTLHNRVEGPDPSITPGPWNYYLGHPPTATAAPAVSSAPLVAATMTNKRFGSGITGVISLCFFIIQRNEQISEKTPTGRGVE